MRVQRAGADLTDPKADGWSQAAAETVALAPMPLDAQPTEYIRVKWADLPYGSVPEAEVAAAHDGSRLFVRIAWADAEEPNVEFHDAAGAFFPAGGAAGGDAPAATMGSAAEPVNLWYWQANLLGAKNLLSRGPGAFHPRAANGVNARAALDDGRWAVVLNGALAEASEGGRLGVAVWNGSNEERAGLGAASPSWISLEID